MLVIYTYAFVAIYKHTEKIFKTFSKIENYTVHRINFSRAKIVNKTMLKNQILKNWKLRGEGGGIVSKVNSAVWWFRSHGFPGVHFLHFGIVVNRSAIQLM